MRQPFGENLVGGDSWNWNLTVEGCDVSFDVASLKYFFRGPAADQALTITAEKQDDGTWNFSASGTDTKKLVGTCSWSLCAYDSDSNRVEIARGTVEVLPDIESATTGFDGRSWVKKSLDAICAVLENRATRVEEEYQIGGRHLKLMKPDELMTLRAQLRAQYKRELINSGQASPEGNQVKAAFGPKRTRTSEGGWR